MITLPKSALRRLPKSIRGEMRDKFNIDISDSGKAQRTFQGRVYHSIAECQYAASLELRKRCKDISGWHPQYRLPLIVDGSLICNMTVDFMVDHVDGTHELIEVKGFEREAYKLMAKLLRALYPQMRYTVVKATRCR